MRRLKNSATYLAAIFMLAGAVFMLNPQPAAFAYDPLNCGTGCSELKDQGLVIGSGTKAKNIINTALTILGGVAVIMVIIGAIRIASSHGDPSQVKAGRETILYALVGIGVAISAFALVNFVVSFNW